MDYLSDTGFVVHASDGCFIRFAAIDSNEVWFGDLNLLGGAIKRDESVHKDEDSKIMMHVFNGQAAEALQDSVFLI